MAQGAIVAVQHFVLVLDHPLTERERRVLAAADCADAIIDVEARHTVLRFAREAPRLVDALIVALGDVTAAGLHVTAVYAG